MRHLRLSIAQIMLLVLFIGLAIGVLRSPTPLLARVTWTVTAALLCWSIVAAIFRHDHRRAFWAGFAVFGWVHLVLTFELYHSFAPAPNPYPLPTLLTGNLVGYLWSHMPPPPASSATVSGVTAGGTTTVIATFDPMNLEFTQIARLLVTLLVAWIGGGLCRLAAGWPSPPVPPSTSDIA